MKAMVLCAGLGTRLRPLTQAWPKPAIPLLGQPLLRYALATLKAGWLVDVRRTNVIESSMAKILAAEIAQEAAALGMEIVGLEAGAGDTLIEKLFRDAKALNIVEGTGQIQRVIIARQLVGLPR